MPTYDYACNDCDHRFEEFQSITAPALETCPKCAGSIRRLISSGNGLIFKGSGFYITDYKKSSGAESKSEKSESPTKAEKKSPDKSTDSKDSSKSSETSN